MITLIQDFSSKSVNGRGESWIGLGLNFNPIIEVIDAGGQEVEDIQDVDALVESDSIVRTTGILTAFTSKSCSVNYESLHPNIVTVDSSGLLTRVADGTATIEVNAGGVKTHYNVDVSQTEATERLVSVIHKVGSLGEHLSTWVDSNIAGKTIENHAKVFSVQDHTGGVYERNLNCWVGSLDLTGLSPWNSTEAGKRAGIAFTPRHIVNAKHYPIANGAIVRFVTSDNQVVARNIIGRAFSPNSEDVAVYTLDTDLPGNIKKYKVLPPNIMDYLPQSRIGRPPMIVLNSNEEVTVREFHRILSSAFWQHHAGNYHIISSTSPVPPDYGYLLPFRSHMLKISVSGDSGNPMGFVVDLGAGREFVLASTFFSPSAGTFLTKDRLDSLILAADANASINSGYTATVADLSDFPTY